MIGNVFTILFCKRDSIQRIQAGHGTLTNYGEGNLLLSTLSPAEIVQQRQSADPLHYHVQSRNGEGPQQFD